MSAALPLPESSALVEWATGQPELFSALELDVEIVKAARVFLHTGKTTCRNEEAVAKIVAAASLGWSQRRIADQLGHSRATVGAVLERAAEAGKVEPLKDRVLAAAGNAIHDDIEMGSELLAAWRGGSSRADLGEIASFRRATWVGAGILADKEGPKQTSVTVNVSGGSVVQVVAEARDRVAKIGRFSDSESGASIDIPAVISHDAPSVIPHLPPADPKTQPAPAPVPDLAGPDQIAETGAGEGGGVENGDGGVGPEGKG